VTTGVRFHPFEILLSLLIKILAIVVIGAPPLAVLLFEIFLNGSSMFNHSNLFLPPTVDRIVRKFIVTPDMHRVHHSVIPYETDSNFGFNFPWWDWLFGTYRDQPESGHEQMTIGLEEFRDTDSLKLPGLLIQPFIQVVQEKRY
jgi:sterol desaturase/sphingolipid hydroxylase (fatty acid hydroxylase superfamily)